MNQKIRSAQELVAWFYDANLRTGKFRKQLLQEGVFVSAAIRREIMLDDKQGELIMNGWSGRDGCLQQPYRCWYQMGFT